MAKKYLLKFRAENKDIFESIRSGLKAVETRAATEKYMNIKKGDVLVLSCDKESFEKTVSKSTIFSTIASLMKAYSAQDIVPDIAGIDELTALYYSFPGYEEKIAKYGLIALELE